MSKRKNLITTIVLLLFHTTLFAGYATDISSTTRGNSYWESAILKLSVHELVDTKLELRMTKIDGSKINSSGKFTLREDRFKGNVLMTTRTGGYSYYEEFKNIDMSTFTTYPKKLYVYYEPDAGGWAWVGAISVTKSTDTPTPVVNAISPSTTFLNENTTFTVSGDNLTNSMGFFISDCINIHSLGGSSTSQKFSCTPSYTTGNKSGIVKDKAGGKVLKNFTLNVKEKNSNAFPETAIKTRNSSSIYVDAQHNAFTKSSTSSNYLIGQCTWYAYGRIMELVASGHLAQHVADDFKKALWTGTGRHAQYWPTKLGIKGEGYSTNTKVLPMEKRKKGLLAIWTFGNYGHVGIVEEVGGANKEWYILSDFNRADDTNYKKVKYKFDSSTTVSGAKDDKVVGVYPTFYELDSLNPNPNSDVKGIDVSDANGKIDWSKVGTTFAYVKATEGYADASFPENKAFDGQFTANMNGAIANNILLGAYHFARPEFNIGVDEAKKEADYFVNKIRSYYQSNKLLPPVIDIETSTGYNKSSLTDWILAFAQELELELGVRPMLYMNEDYVKNKVDSSRLKSYKLWEAKYSTSKPVTDSWNKYTFWQYTSSASENGISGNVDKNIFEGTVEELKSELVQSSPAVEGNDFYLVGESLDKDKVIPNGIVRATVTHSYQGSSEDELSVQLGYYLSKNTVWDSRDVYLDSDKSTLGKPDLSNVESESLKIPSDTALGEYYILFVTDHVLQYSETNEANNVKYQKISVIKKVVTPVLASVDSLSFLEGTPYSQQLTLRRGSHPIVYAVRSTPTSMISVDSSGLIYWENPKAGEYHVTAKATNSATSHEVSWTITVTAKDTDGDGIPNDQDPDDDNDGISDTDEIANGLNPLDPSDATADNDGDGYTNKEEIDKGTDINDANSKPTPEVITRTITIRKGFGLYGMNSSMTLVQLIEKIGVDNLLSINSNGETYQLKYVQDDLEFLNDFTQLEPFKAVWIEVANEVEIDYDEIGYTDNQEISLEGGKWYLLNPPKEMSLDEIKAQVGVSNIDVIQGFVTTYQQQYVDEGTDFLNDFTGFSEPNGYWVKLKEDAVLRFEFLK